MAWNNQGGGPWGGGSSGSGGGGRGTPPDLEDLIKKGQDNIRRFIPLQGGPAGKQKLILGALVILGLWLSSGIYQVQEGEKAAVLRFGKWVDTTSAGIHYHFPFPIESKIVARVDTINRIDSGVEVKSKAAFQAVNSANLMLTGDENIVAIQFTVHWYIKDLGKFLFMVDVPELAVKNASESAVREIISQIPFAFAQTKGRGEIISKAQMLLQKMMDDYNTGIQIQRIQLKNVDPPEQVIDSFRDVQRAKADQESKINEAKAYSNSVVPVARGEAAKITQAAEGYKKAVVNKAEGESKRFLSILTQYKKAPEITRKRMMIETTQFVLQGANKIIMEDKNGTQGVLPYLPLPMMKEVPVEVPAAQTEAPLVKQQEGRAQ